MGRRNQTGPAGTSQSNQNQLQLKIPLRQIQRMIRRPATTRDSNRHNQRDPATSSTSFHNKTNGHSDTEPSPKAHRKPKSIHSTAPKPSGRLDMEPNLPKLPESKLVRNRPHYSSGRNGPNPPCRCNTYRCDASFAR